MYKICFEFIVTCVILCFVSADICRTPDGDVGECMPFLGCAELVNSYIKSDRNHRSFIIDSVCETGNETGLMLCCSMIKGRLAIGLLPEKVRVQPEIVIPQISLRNSKHCGIQTRQSSIPIGESASLNEFPWLVYILTVNEPEGGSPEHSIACSGTLINSRYVLSGAQCLVNAGGASATFLVGIEELPVENRTDEKYESCNNGNCSEFHYYGLDQILIYPYFNEYSNLHDIALLKSNTVIWFTDYLRPACLPLFDFKAGHLLYTAGYKTWSSKVKITSTLISRLGCNVIHHRRGISKIITGYEICGIKSEDDSCNDENIGNPAFVFDDEQWYLVGIYSWSGNCSHNYPKVYTRVSPYLKWIEMNVRDGFKNDEAAAEDVSVTLQNPKNCGSQRQDKYNTTDGPISPDEFPWMTYIIPAGNVDDPNEFDGNYRIACTGSLITSRYVLSSAQCLLDDVDPSSEFFIAIEEFHVQDATNCTEFAPFYDWNCSTWNYYEPNVVTIHPFYNRWTYENDIALLRLNGIVTFADYIRPLCLPLPGFKRAGSGDTLQTSSYIEWGVKTKASIRLLTNNECKLRIKQINGTEVVHKHEMCAVKLKNSAKIACEHYIGGPVMYSNNNRWHLEAIHSRSGACTNRAPTIYTRVADHLPWIQANIKDDRCTTPNGNTGDCIPLNSCPELLRPFTNPKKEQERYMQKFICEINNKGDLMVCCPRVMDNFTFQNEEEESTIAESDFLTELANSENCGLHRHSTYEPKDGIIPVDEFPWLVDVVTFSPTPDNESFTSYVRRCTGTLISSRYVVASAECASVFTVNVTRFAVRITEYSDGDTKNCAEFSPFYQYNCTKFSQFELDERVVHLFYNPWTGLNNIALLRLNRAVPFTGYIRPICLRLPGTEVVHKQEMVYTAGYINFSVKSKATSKLISNSECKRIFKQKNEVSSITEYEMCTMKSKSATEVTCDLKKGSPIMSFSNNRWYLEGIHSKGDICTNRVPTIYTRVSNYLQWIQGHTRPENCTTPHGEPGKCIHLKDCPQLLNAFANPEKRNDGKLDPYLLSFECPRDKNPDIKADVIVVCCGLSPNFTIRQEPDYKDLEKKNAIEFDNSLYCGLQHKDDYYSISDDISIDEYPWSAAIYLSYTIYIKKKRRIICTGALISRRYVLTAANCLTLKLYWDTITVRLGEYHVRNATDCVEFPEIESEDCTTVQEYQTEKVIVHTFYDYSSALNDIALVRLEKRVQFSDYVRPICLPSPKVTYVNPGDTLYTTGWGESITKIELFVDEGELKKKISTTLITNEECTESRQNIYGTTDGVVANQFCTRDFRNETDFLCDVDTGSPLMSKYRNKWYVIGIASRNACKRDEPQIHTNVTAYLGWIRRAVEVDEY